MSKLFEKGDVVNLKSGSPDMTITYIDGEDVYVKWFDKDGKVQKDVFPESSLEPAEEK